MLQIEGAFPRLIDSTYSIESPATSDYNCIAWAAGSNDRWWWPDIQNLYYWPEGARREETVQAFVEVFQTFGFEVCAGSELENGFEKIALYVDDNGIPTHAARQLPSGGWTSKLGKEEDIEHEELTALDGPLYGTAELFMQREDPDYRPD